MVPGLGTQFDDQRLVFRSPSMVAVQAIFSSSVVSLPLSAGRPPGSIDLAVKCAGGVRMTSTALISPRNDQQSEPATGPRQRPPSDVPSWCGVDSIILDPSCKASDGLDRQGYQYKQCYFLASASASASARQRTPRPQAQPPLLAQPGLPSCEQRGSSAPHRGPSAMTDNEFLRRLRRLGCQMHQHASCHHNCRQSPQGRLTSPTNVPNA